jgi:hypothetical protein
LDAAVDLDLDAFEDELVEHAPFGFGSRLAVRVLDGATERDGFGPDGFGIGLRRSDRLKQCSAVWMSRVNLACFSRKTRDRVLEMQFEQLAALILELVDATSVVVLGLDPTSGRESRYMSAVQGYPF